MTNDLIRRLEDIAEHGGRTNFDSRTLDAVREARDALKAAERVIKPFAHAYPEAHDGCPLAPANGLVNIGWFPTVGNCRAAIDWIAQHVEAAE